jgi:cytidine deaminase
VTPAGHDPPAAPRGDLWREPDHDWLGLWERARAAAPRAYAPYSGFHVGALLLAGSGRSYLGVNVENASYPVGLCAERAALAAAVADGERRFAALAVATADGRDAAPCGACLQALGEFGDLEIVAQVDGRVRVAALHALLTAPFAAPGSP